MWYVRLLLLLAAPSAVFAQPPQTASTPPPPTGTTKAAPKTEPETEADKTVRQAAEKLDAIEFVSARMRQLIRYADQNIVAAGSYKRGPGHRVRVEFTVQSGEASASRLHVCDGTNGYTYEKSLETEAVRKFDIRQILPLIERKQLPAEVRQQLLFQLPVAKPGDMLRGYLKDVSFTKVAKKIQNQTNVMVVEGQWKPAVLARLTGKPDAKVDDVQGLTPQFVSLTLDEKSGWPLRIELFRRDKQALYKPVYVLEFLDLALGTKLADKEFAFAVPPNLVAQDITVALVQQLQTLPDVGAATTPPASVTAPPAGTPPAIKQ